MSVQTCCNCKWFHPVESSEIYDDKLSPEPIGHCERYPPFTTPAGHLNAAGFLLVYRIGSCGEWKMNA